MDFESSVKQYTLASMAPPTLGEIQANANQVLREAMANERSKRWAKVISSYRRLVKILSREQLPRDFKPPSWLPMLLYEIHYHLGIALQQAGEHKKAVQQYTKAIEAVFIPKNGCLAGCNSNSCLMTPVYARRAFAYALAGDLKHALKDAEKTVVLDSKNPDVFCIRALVRGTTGDEREALKDVESALKINPNHLCALIVRGKLAQPLSFDDWMGIEKESASPDHVKACLLNPDCHNFLQVQDFNHPDILNFYDRFLYSLSVPHTISEINFPAGTSSRMSSRASTRANSRAATPMSMGTTTTGTKSVRFYQNSEAPSSVRPVVPFRAGTPAGFKSAAEQTARRKQYGESVREHVFRPKTAEEYIAYIEKERQKKQMQMNMMNSRPSTPGSRASPVMINGRVSVASSRTMMSEVNSRQSGPGKTYSNAPANQPPAQKSKVFQKINLRDAPRMYYRPWLGDKLPVAEVDRKEWITPPFKV